MLIWGCAMTVVLTAAVWLVAGRFHWLFVCYGLALAVLMMLRLYCRDPEKAIRKQLKSPEVAAHVCGLWQVSLTEEAFYLFHRDKKHFVTIAKESFLSWDQVHLFHQICADHDIQKIAPKKARYVPLWLLLALFGLFLLLCLGGSYGKDLSGQWKQSGICFGG